MKDKESDQYRELESAFRALWDFCQTEMGWMFFRAEFELSDNPSATLENAASLRTYLSTLKQTPVVEECLKSGSSPFVNDGIDNL